MLTYRKSLKLAQAWVEIVSDGEAVILPEQTLDKPYGWIFFYQSKRFLKTNENSARLAGNAPIIIDRINLEIRITGTAKPLKTYIAEYETTLPPATLLMTPEARPKP